MKNMCAAIVLLAFSNVLSAQEVVLNGPYTVDFRITDANDELLIACGGDAQADYADDALMPAQGVVCKAFRDVPLMPEALKHSDCETDREAFFVLPAHGNSEIRWACQGDAPFVGPNVSFEVGEEVRGKGWICRREEDGLSCINQDGHGFIVNSKGYHLLGE